MTFSENLLKVCGATFSRRDLRNHHMKATHYPDERPPQRVLELLEGKNWEKIPITIEHFIFQG